MPIIIENGQELVEIEVAPAQPATKIKLQKAEIKNEINDLDLKIEECQVKLEILKLKKQEFKSLLTQMK